MIAEELTIAKVVAKLQKKELSVRELTEFFIQRQAKLEPKIKAWAYVQPVATLLARAAEIDQKGLVKGATLTGIPYGGKDIIYTKGIPTEAGSKTLNGFIPTRDATVIEQLTTAGALLFGKTTTAEFASGGGAPATCNPWNNEHTPGGSSSGSAAAVSSGMALFAIGTQTSGSVIRPAAYTGVTALKPTYGQLSKSGIIPASWSIDTVGIFTRTVEDVTLVYNQLVGQDGRDDTTISARKQKLSLGESSYHLAVVTDDYFQGSPEVMQAFEAAIRLLARCGFTIGTAQMPKLFAAANEAHGIVVDSETAAYHRDYPQQKELYSPELKADIEAGLAYTATDYLQAQALRWDYQQQLFELLQTVDVLVTPATPTTAPQGLKTTGSPRFNKPFSNGGVPVLTMPIGFSQKTGLPIGIQLIANRFSEQKLIDIGRAFQQVSDVHRQLPIIR